MTNKYSTMKKDINKNLKWALFIVLLIVPVAFNVLYAQPGPPPPPAPPPPGVPIDGGIALLLSGLAAYGAKKYFKK